MRFDYCAMHSGAVIGEQDLNCRVIRHDDGTAAKPAEVWAEIERLRSIGREAAEAATMHQAEVLRLRAKTAGIEEIASALRLAIADKRAFVVCVDGRNGSTFTLHNCDDATICARMLERFARQQRGNDK